MQYDAHGANNPSMGAHHCSLGVQTIQNGVDKFAWGIGHGIVRNCRETVCNLISVGARNVNFGAAPKSTKIALIHGRQSYCNNIDIAQDH